MMETSSVMKRLLLTMVAAAAAAATVATVAAATAAPGCCAPAKWEGEYKTTYLLHDNSSGSVTVTEDVYMAYDSLNNRTVVMKNKTQNSCTERLINLYLHKDGVSYEYDMDTGNCTAKNLSAVYPGFCIPAIAQVTNPSVSVSLGNGEVQASVMTYQIPDSGGNTQGVVFVRNDNCLLLSLNLFVSSTESLGLYQDMAIKAAEGITSMAVFDIPAACKNIVPSFGPKATHAAPHEMGMASMWKGPSWLTKPRDLSSEDDLTRGLL